MQWGYLWQKRGYSGEYVYLQTMAVGVIHSVYKSYCYRTILLFSICTSTSSDVNPLTAVRSAYMSVSWAMQG